MTRLEAIKQPLRSEIAQLKCPTFEKTPWTAPPALSSCRIAIISTAGLYVRNDRPFSIGSNDFRQISIDTLPENILMSHASTNFDRSGFQQDLNVVFPIERLKEMAQKKFIGSVANYHFSFMGATDPLKMMPAVSPLVKKLKNDNVDAVLLVPV